ncbi:MAG: hypothetical protein V1726_00615 [Methanobacteriota archaeon]
MGFSLTGSHVIFFIASLIVAGAVSGIFIAITLNISTSLTERGERLQEQLDVDFKIINDPDEIPTDDILGDYLFYLKNIGGKKLVTTNETFDLFIDGEILTITKYNFTEDTISVGEVTTIWVDPTAIVGAGDHTLRVVGPMAIEDEFAFTV